MSKWDEAHTEPMHDHPAEKDQLVAAMEAAGYTLDTLESTGDNLRFYGAFGNILTMGGWHECEEWLNGVVFDDPQVSDRVEIILHPELFRNAIRREPPFVLWRMPWNRTTTALTGSSTTCRSRILPRPSDSKPDRLNRQPPGILSWRSLKPIVNVLSRSRRQSTVLIFFGIRRKRSECNGEDL